MVGLAEALEDVVLLKEVDEPKVVADVDDVLDVDEETTDELPTLYIVKPFGPPHVKLEFPAQIILQRPSVTGELPEPSALPQKHSRPYSTPKNWKDVQLLAQVSSEMLSSANAKPLRARPPEPSE